MNKIAIFALALTATAINGIPSSPHTHGFRGASSSSCWPYVTTKYVLSRRRVYPKPHKYCYIFNFFSQKNNGDDSLHLQVSSITQNLIMVKISQKSYKSQLSNISIMPKINHASKYNCQGSATQPQPMICYLSCLQKSYKRSFILKAKPAKDPIVGEY